MAYEFLKAQNASPIVASVKVDAAKGAVLENANCEVGALQAADGKVSFDFLPRSLPLPVNDEYCRAEKVIPLTDSLNREMLTVQGLAQGRYALLLDDKNAGEFPAEELAAGVNIATLEANPGQRRAKAVDALIQERAGQEKRIRQLRQMECGMPNKKSREEFAAHGLEVASEMMLLLRLNFLASAKRRAWWKAHEPSALFVLSERPSFAIFCTCVESEDGPVGCGHKWSVPADAGRPKVCPECGHDDLKITTSDATDYAWFYFGHRFKGIYHL
jgi:hypothetical protein